MDPMYSLILMHTRPADVHQVAGLRRINGGQPVRVPQIHRSRTDGRVKATGRTGLRALLRSAAELPQRLAATLRPAA